MEVLVFRTDIKSKKKVKYISPILSNNKAVLDWSIDLEDIDNVLRIEATPNLKEKDVIGLVKMNGFYIEALED